MAYYICTGCFTQFAESVEYPDNCPICSLIDHDDEDEVARVPKWVTSDELRDMQINAIQYQEPSLVAIGMSWNQSRGLLVLHPAGNVLWNCVAALDQAVVDLVQGYGGISTIVIPSPSHCGSMVDWAIAFEAPILIHSADREWIMRPDSRVEFWDGDTKSLREGVTLIRCGGSPDGGTALHWPSGANGKGALFSVNLDPFYSFLLYLIDNSRSKALLSVAASEALFRAVASFSFDRIYGRGWGDQIETNAGTILRESFEAQIEAVASRNQGNS